MTDHSSQFISHKTSLFSNPFCTHWITPSSCEFHQRFDGELQHVIQTMIDSGYRGQIAGPHGVGKSTLMHQICKQLKMEGLNPVQMNLDLQLVGNSNKEIPVKNCIWVIDRFESLTRRQQSRIIKHTKRQSIGLLVTAHRQLSLPVVARLSPDVDHAIAVVRNLQSRVGKVYLDDDDVRQLWSECQNDLRELLMACYDKWQERSRALATLVV